MIEKSEGYFSNGFNCAQAVFTPFAEAKGIKEKDALKLASSFGSGINEGLVCGAVIGACLAIGINYGYTDGGDISAKEKTKNIVTSFKQKFREKFGTINCSELLGLDMSDPEMKARAGEDGLYITKCPEFVSYAAKLVEELTS